MPDDLPAKDDLTDVLAREVVGPLFAALPAPWNDPASLPRPVLRSRREQARRRLVEALSLRATATLDDDLRDLLARLVTRWAQREFDGGFADAEAFELRCDQDRLLAEAAASGDPTRLRAAREEVHRQRVVEEYDRIEIRGLQLSERVSQSLEVAYVQLHLDDPTRAETITLPDPAQMLEAARALQPGKKPGKRPAAKKPRAKAEPTAPLTFTTTPRLPAPEVIARHPKLLVVGAPGGGKSTLSAWIAVQVARGALAPELRERAPFVLPVRALRGEGVGVVALAQIHGVDEGFVREALAGGRGFVVVDGLDEAPEGIAAIAAQVLALAREFPEVRVVVTSRPALLAEGEADPFAAMTDGGFVRATVGTMTRGEVYTFIARWCLAAEISIQRDRAAAEATAAQNADDLRARLRANEAVERLAETPLLCSVLCVVHRFMGNRIPERRVALYEACTNVLLYEWDRAKFPPGSVIGRLDAPQKRALLAGLARAMHEKHVAEVGEAEVLAHFERELPALGEPATDARKVLDEIRGRSGVLVERRRGAYGFSHLLYQEYLTAVAYAHAGEVVSLAKRAKNRWWHEVIALAAGVPDVAAGELIEKLLGNGEVGVILAAACVETAVVVAPALRERVEGAIAAMMPGTPRAALRLARLSSHGLSVLTARIRKSPSEVRGSIFKAASDLDSTVAVTEAVRTLQTCSRSISTDIIFAATYLIWLMLSSAKDTGAEYVMVLESFPKWSDAGLTLFSYGLRSFGEHPIFATQRHSDIRDALTEEFARRGIDSDDPTVHFTNVTPTPAPRTDSPPLRSASAGRSAAPSPRRRAP